MTTDQHDTIAHQELFKWKPEIPNSFYRINPWHSILMALTGLSLYIFPLLAAFYLLPLPLGALLKFIIIIFTGLLAAIGNVLLSIFTHEAAHFSLFANRKLNQIAGIICLSVTPAAFLSCIRFYETHAQHHKYLFTLKDPEDIFAPYIDPVLTFPMVLLGMKNTILYLLRYSLNSLQNLFKPIQEEKSHEAEYHFKSSNSLFIFECVFYFVCLGFQIYLMWICPLLILVYLIANLIALATIVIVGHASHAFNSSLDIQNKTLTKWIATFFLKSSFGTFLHLEHHAYPTVPAYQLAALSRYLYSQGFYTQNNIQLGSVHLLIVQSG